MTEVVMEQITGDRIFQILKNIRPVGDRDYYDDKLTQDFVQLFMSPLTDSNEAVSRNVKTQIESQYSHAAGDEFYEGALATILQVSSIFDNIVEELPALQAVFCPIVLLLYTLASPAARRVQEYRERTGRWKKQASPGKTGLEEGDQLV